MFSSASINTPINQSLLSLSFFMVASQVYPSPVNYSADYSASIHVDATNLQNLQDKNSINKITNLKTTQTMKDSQKGKNLIKYNSLKEMFNDCWK
jgi:glutamine synthetase type III